MSRNARTLPLTVAMLVSTSAHAQSWSPEQARGAEQQQYERVDRGIDEAEAGAKQAATAGRSLLDQHAPSVTRWMTEVAAAARDYTGRGAAAIGQVATKLAGHAEGLASDALDAGRRLARSVAGRTGAWWQDNGDRAVNGALRWTGSAADAAARAANSAYETAKPHARGLGRELARRAGDVARSGREYIGANEDAWREEGGRLYGRARDGAATAAGRAAGYADANKARWARGASHAAQVAGGAARRGYEGARDRARTHWHDNGQRYGAYARGTARAVGDNVAERWNAGGQRRRELGRHARDRVSGALSSGARRAASGMRGIFRR